MTVCRVGVNKRCHHAAMSLSWLNARFKSSELAFFQSHIVLPGKMFASFPASDHDTFLFLFKSLERYVWSMSRMLAMSFCLIMAT